MAKTKTPAADKAVPVADGDPAKAIVDRGATTTTITFRGEKFSFPTSQSDWPTRALQRFQSKANADGIELLLGPAQWERFNEVAPIAREFWEFWGVFLGAVNSGVPTNGNGSAPTAPGGSEE
jgi:hypothetical protein